MPHLLTIDPYLAPYRSVIERRNEQYRKLKHKLAEKGDLTGQISQGYNYFGFNRGQNNGKKGVWYREWAPAASYLSLIGDFNGWDREANPLQRDEHGVWSLFLSDNEYGKRLTHQSLLKVHVRGNNGSRDRIPAYITRVVQNQEHMDFAGQYWQPKKAYIWKNKQPKSTKGLRIYEAHVGMAGEEGKVSSFKEFTASMLPRIKDLGYNAVQLMAIAEHPYYASFGYHVANFFAVSSRYGTPEDLKELVDTAHGLGLNIIMDLVHSHAVKNINEGLAEFDGSKRQYFHQGARREHPAWDSLCFDYGNHDTLHFLLSNTRYWIEEFKFDGYRFDGVTSMMYLDHGLSRDFVGYEDYYGGNVDEEALVYLALANDLIHALNPQAITVAEDVSGMPGLALPISQGGLGFDYRLAMGIPDYWTKIIKERRDESWGIGDIWFQLTNRRPQEKHIAYAESHDQALVGGKTLAFELMDKDMYYHMSVLFKNDVVSRGLALHKIIRLLTFTLGGEGYLNFMGNEFGHPEWIDFPRAGNDNSYHHARRQWSLVDDDLLLYKGLNRFDRAMQRLDDECRLLSGDTEQLFMYEKKQVMAYRKGKAVIVVNLNPTQSFTDLRIPVPQAKDYRLLLNTDSKEFEGQGIIEDGAHYPWQQKTYGPYGQSIQVYVPARSAIVLI